jgi:outer membrane protein assembly factor BamD (BamD/ComL family)
MRQGRTGCLWLTVGAVALTAGCTPIPHKPTADKPGVVQAGHKEDGGDGDKPPRSPVQHDGLLAAEEAYKREEFGKAEGMFADIADDTKNRPEVAERARFYQGECLRRQDKYPKAVDTYHKLLQDFPAGLYREQAIGQMFLIASEWLQPVRDEIAEKAKPAAERKEKSWTDAVIPANFSTKMPTFDAEGRALATLEKVYFNDPAGVHADKALFMLGRVHFERGNYKDSARFFQQLAEAYDRSPLRDHALELAIVAKTASAGGPQYDSREAAEAMRLINAAKATSPTLNQRQDGKFLDQQALMVRYQQAEKDFETAEFYRRTGHPGSAWFYYELVLRRYPGIKPFADQAAARQKELKAELDESNNPTTMGSTRRFWKQYVLGHEVPKPTNEPGGTLPKELPEPRPAPPLPGAAGPADGVPR